MVHNEASNFTHQNILMYNDKKEINIGSTLSNSRECLNRSNTEKLIGKHGLCVSHRTTYFQTLFHLIKCHIGSGMFAVGDVFRNDSGLLLAPLLTVCLAIMCIWHNHILVNCSKEIKNKKKLSFYPTYPDTVGWAFEFGRTSFQKWSFIIRDIVKGLNIVTQLGCCVVYFIFISSSLQSLLQMLARHGIVVDEHLIIVIIFFPVVLSIFLRNLQFLTLFSVLASVFIFFTVSLTLYISFSDLPQVTSRPSVAHWSQIPLFFGTSIYCFEGIAQTLPMHNETILPARQVGQFSMLIVILAVVGSLFVLIALICFIKFVDDLAGNNFISDITFNFSQNYLFSEVTHLIIGLALLFSYTLQFHIALMLIWPDLVKSHGPTRHAVLAELGVRLLLAFCTFTAVEVVPMLGVVVSLTGALCGTLLALLLPPLCDLTLHWDHNPHSWKHFFDFFSIFLAVVGFFVGILYMVMIIVKGVPNEEVPNT